MKKTLLILISALISFASISQNNLEFEFDQARVKLAQRDLEPAINSLRKVYTSDRSNSNVNFLLGAAYTELSGHQKEAIFHLKKAVQNVDKNYKVGSFEEKSAPIHVYYYLAIALVEEDLCAQANKAYEKFKEYKEQVNKYFIEELERHLQKCPFEKEDVKNEWKKVVEVPEGYSPDEIIEETFEVDSALIAQKGLVTQKLAYTTKAPLYGVQIGSNLNPSPTSNFKDVKNVDVFIDNDGIIRYVVGHFSYRKQAETLLSTLIEKGFKDAFVVNVNDERKYSNEVISYNNINLRAGITGKIEYYVQVGAFKDTIPNHLAKLYLEIDDIQEVKNKEMTVLMVGEFPNYQDAINRQEQIQLEGIKDAFIVAYHKGKKIPLEEAIRYDK
tara:strand:+ start:10594 stop:11751 length:1158 start_codon:yes stop_codon:yes gene_type:complete